MTDHPEGKRPPGRPPTGKARKVQLPASLVQPETLKWIEDERARRGVSRGAVVDELVAARMREEGSE